jgi:signal peptidase I
MSQEPSATSDDPRDPDPSKTAEPTASKAVGPPAPLVEAVTARPILRYLFLAIWFVLLPGALALFAVSNLAPASGIEAQGPFALLQNFVRDQPVPSTIGLFVLGETLFWFGRHKLPLARYAYPPLPAGADPQIRPYFERARALADEAAVLLKARSAIMPKGAREKVEEALVKMQASMTAAPFDQDVFLKSVDKVDEVIDVQLGAWRKSEGREYLESILVAIGIALALRSFVFEAFKIPSGSMIPTLQVGDHIFVNKFSYGPTLPFSGKRIFSHLPPDRGDVMVFQFPERPEQDFIKRVIALPGDTLSAKNGHPILNGWEVPSCFVGVYTYSDKDPNAIGKHEGDLFVEYLGDRAYVTLYDHMSALMPETQGPYHVKQGEVWVMGDNRHNSHDSRLWFNGLGGGVPFANIKGKALFVWLSYSEGTMDWSRFGVPVMGRPRVPPDMKHLEPGIAKCLREKPANTVPPVAPSVAAASH